MIAKTLRATEGKSGIIPAGTEIVHPDAYKLVLLGVAEPVDKDCRVKLAEIEQQKIARQAHKEQLKPRPKAPEPVAQETPKPSKPKAEPVK